MSVIQLFRTIPSELKSVVPCLQFKVAGNPVTLKVGKPGIQADRLLCLVKIVANSQFWGSSSVLCP